MHNEAIPQKVKAIIFYPTKHLIFAFSEKIVIKTPYASLLYF